ncbi:MAG: hypothetical protein IKT40_11855 [Bacilli bacterium]|nr:hypothetical protein [Bacilli bacterium]
MIELKHIDNLYKEIGLCISRYIKNLDDSYSLSNISDFCYKLINSIKIEDCVIEELINCVLDEGKITLEEFMIDINSYIDYNNNRYLSSKFYKVHNINDVINFIRIKQTNVALLTDFVNRLFYWSATKSGEKLYYYLAQIIDGHLFKKYQVCINKFYKYYKKL